MHIKVNKKQFESAVVRAEKITGKNLSLAVLKAVLLIAEKDTLTLRATNLDLGIELTVPAQVTTPGTVAVSGDVLSTLLTNTRSADPVTFELKNGTVHITIAGTTADINTYPHEDFPTLPDIRGGTQLKLPVEDMVKGLKAVSYSASTSSMKPELASVLIQTDEKELVFAATDSFRLAEKKITTKERLTSSSLLLPLKNIPEILRNLEATTEAVEVVMSDNQIAFTSPSMYFTSRVVDGVFPDYGQIIPKEFITEATILKEDLISTLKVSTIFSNKFNQVLFKVSTKKKQFVIETRNPEIGESSVAVDAALSGEDIEIGFNHKYVFDSFQSITSDSVTLRFSGVGKPLVIQNVGDHSFTYLVMPMNR